MYNSSSQDTSVTADQQWNPVNNPNAAYIYILISNGPTASATITLTDPQCENGTTTTSYEPYSNICPISGRTGLTVYRTGFNLCQDSVHTNHFWESGVLKTNKNANYAAIDIKVPVVPGEDYCVYVPDNTGGIMYFSEFDESESYLGIQQGAISGSNFAVFTASSETRFIAIGFYKSGGVSVGERICVSLSGPNDGTFEPYQGATYSMDWGNQFSVNDATNIENGTNKKLSVSDGLLTVTATGAVSSTVIVTSSALSSVIENATLPAGIYSFSVSDFSATVTGAILDSIKLRITTNGVDAEYSRNTPIILTSESTIKSITASTALQWNSGNTIQFRITIDSAVYGGSLDVVTGQLTVDMAIVDLGTLTWVRSGADYYGSSDALPNVKTPPNGGIVVNAVCSSYIVTASNNVSAGRVNGIGVRPNGMLYATYNGASPTGYLVYELATPLTCQLTPQEVVTLVGQNNIFSPDATSIKVAVSNPRIEQVTP